VNILALKIEFNHNIQNLDKNCNFTILTKIKIPEGIVYVISQLIFWGQGNSSGKTRNIAENIAETLGKILGKFCELEISPKLMHYP